jgi:methyl-accepting chemotaxis protein
MLGIVSSVMVIRERAKELFDLQRVGWRRLSVTLSLRMALTTLIPLIAVAFMVIVSLSRSTGDLKRGVFSVRQAVAQDVIGAALQSQAEAAMSQVDAYMHERVEDVKGWAGHSIIQRAAKDAAEEAERLGLLSVPEAQVEMLMSETYALSDDAELTEYLVGLTTHNAAFADILLTDEHGFTVAYDKRPAHFIQANEAWWEAAWEQDVYIGNVEYDDSAGVYAVIVAVRIEDVNDTPVGVLKAGIDIQGLQQMARDTTLRVAGIAFHPMTDAACQTCHSDAELRAVDSEVHLFTGQGDQIANTVNGNDPTLIMTSAGNLLKRGWEAARLILEQEQGESGYLLDQQSLDGKPVVVGYASSTLGMADGGQRTGELDWRLAVAQTEETAFAPLRSLDEGVVRMDRMRASIVRLILGVGAMAGVGAVVVALLAARLIVRPIVELAQVSQRVAAGDFGGVMQAEQSNEIGQLQDAFFQMTVQLRRTLDDERDQREYLQAVIAEYMTFVASIARGDLTARLALDDEGWHDDPLIVLGHSLNEMADNLRSMTMRIKEVAQHLGSTASRISAVTTQQASGASEQSAAISQTTTTVDELKTIAEQAVARAQEVASASQRTVEVSRDGQRAVFDTIGSMAHIRSRVEGIAENILALSEQTQQIGEIITTVNDLAAQSNILALNASVEAARAGEYGKGFAVVAVEVRNLAEQSRQATAQVRAILSDIQKATNATVMATEEGTKGVAEGTELASQAGEAIEQLAAVIEESTQASMQVVAGGRQQAAGVEQIAVAMQNINQVTVQGLSSTRQAEEAAQELGKLARSLTEIVEQYKL